MNRHRAIVTTFIALLSLVSVGVYAANPPAPTAPPPPDHPVLDMVATKVIQKYQQSSCEDLWKAKTQKAPPTAEEKDFLELLRNDSQLRVMFLDKVAAPIANKMFECGMIP